MTVHHGKEGQVAIGGTALGELTSFTLETTGDVVESTKWKMEQNLLLLVELLFQVL